MPAVRLVAGRGLSWIAGGRLAPRAGERRPQFGEWRKVGRFGGLPAFHMSPPRINADVVIRATKPLLREGRSCPALNGIAVWSSNPLPHGRHPRG